MFVKTTVRIVKILWASVLVVFGLAWTLLCMAVAFFGGMICAPFCEKGSNPFAVTEFVWIFVLRQVFYRAAGVRIFIQNTVQHINAWERVLVGMNHGSLLGMLMSVWAANWYLPRPVRWVIKQELMKWWKIGPALVKIGLGWPIPRTDAMESVVRLQTMGDGFVEGAAAIFIDGTRPTYANIEEGKRFYRERLNRPDYATLLRFTARPRPKGFRTLCRTVPHDRRIRIFVTSSVHEEGWIGLVDLMFTGAIFVRIEEWKETLNPEDEQVFADQLDCVWLWSLQDWIAHRRTWWATYKRGRWWRNL